MKNIKLFALSSLIVIICSSCVQTANEFTSHSNTSSLTGAEAGIQKLKQGNARFVNGQSIHPNQSAARIKEVAPTQHPFAIILSCSDSRVPPEVVFDQGIGDLFVVRTAGEVADSAAIASIEYAIEHLEVRSLLIMGHESCGAVKAAMSTPAGKSAGSPSLDILVGSIRPHIKDFEVGNPNDPNVRQAVSAQVDSVAKELVESSHIIKEFVEQKKLYFARGLYSLQDGSVAFWAEGYPEVAAHDSSKSLHPIKQEAVENHKPVRADPALRR